MEEGDSSIYYPSKIYQKTGMEQKGQPIGNGDQHNPRPYKPVKGQFFHSVVPPGPCDFLSFGILFYCTRM